MAATAFSTAAISSVSGAEQQQGKEFYEWRVYETRWNSAPLENFLSKALIPALNRLGVKNVGVFTEIGKPDPVKIYVLIPYASLEAYGKVNASLKKDKEFNDASADYNSIPMDKAAYWRFESSLMIAFDGLPKMIVPKNESRIFEVRSYEGYSEDAVRRKIKMFNDEEFIIFNRVRLNPVFFGEVIAGKDLPRLTYMITFKNLEEREKNWQAFLADPDWLRITKDPQYENTVSKIYKTFLEPTAYSQV